MICIGAVKLYPTGEVCILPVRYKQRLEPSNVIIVVIPDGIECGHHYARPQTSFPLQPRRRLQQMVDRLGHASMIG